MKIVSTLAVPKSLENCYCEVTDTNLDALIKGELLEVGDGPFYKDEGVIFYMPKDLRLCIFKEEKLLNKNTLKIEYNKQINNWVYCPKENKMAIGEDTIEAISAGTKATVEGVDYEMSDDDTALLLSLRTKEQESLNLVDEIVGVDFAELLKKPINNFEEYGFKADFDGRIYDKFEDGSLIGSARLDEKHPRIAVKWLADGTTSRGMDSVYNLTPIKPEPTYPIFKKDTDGTITKFTSATEGQVLLTEKADDYWSPVPQANYFQPEADVPYDAERCLYHGQPCWLHTPYDSSIRFYSVEYKTVADITGDLVSTIDSVTEPIPLKALQHMPFVWKPVPSLYRRVE